LLQLEFYDMTRAHVITGSFGSGDSRIEIVLTSAPTAEFLEVWRSLLRDAANPRPG
jgi:hypothetical protein